MTCKNHNKHIRTLNVSERITDREVIQNEHKHTVGLEKRWQEMASDLERRELWRIHEVPYCGETDTRLRVKAVRDDSLQFAVSELVWWCDGCASEPEAGTSSLKELLVEHCNERYRERYEALSFTEMQEMEKEAILKIKGMGADLIIADDPVREPTEAERKPTSRGEEIQKAVLEKQKAARAKKEYQVDPGGFTYLSDPEIVITNPTDRIAKFKLMNDNTIEPVGCKMMYIHPPGTPGGACVEYKVVKHILSDDDKKLWIQGENDAADTPDVCGYEGQFAIRNKVCPVIRAFVKAVPGLKHELDARGISLRNTLSTPEVGEERAVYFADYANLYTYELDKFINDYGSKALAAEAGKLLTERGDGIVPFCGDYVQSAKRIK